MLRKCYQHGSNIATTSKIEMQFWTISTLYSCNSPPACIWYLESGFSCETEFAFAWV